MLALANVREPSVIAALAKTVRAAVAAPVRLAPASRPFGTPPTQLGVLSQSPDASTFQIFGPGLIDDSVIRTLSHSAGTLPSRRSAKSWKDVNLSRSASATGTRGDVNPSASAQNCLLVRSSLNARFNTAGDAAVPG